MAKRKQFIELEPLVCCIPSRKDAQPGPLVKRLTRRFYHKSGTELRLEAEQQIKLLPTLQNF